MDQRCNQAQEFLLLKAVAHGDEKGSHLAVVLPPAVGSAYAAAPVYGGATVVDGRTGRSCTIKPDGYRWCWTP
jgi:hypothetical protein